MWGRRGCRAATQAPSACQVAALHAILMTSERSEAAAALTRELTSTVSRHHLSRCPALRSPYATHRPREPPGLGTGLPAAARSGQASCGHSLPSPGPRLAMNAHSVWKRSTRWMLFRFGSTHRKHSEQTQLQVSPWLASTAGPGLQRPITVDVNKGSGGGGVRGGGLLGARLLSGQEHKRAGTQEPGWTWRSLKWTGQAWPVGPTQALGLPSLWPGLSFRIRSSRKRRRAQADSWP